MGDFPRKQCNEPSRLIFAMRFRAMSACPSVCPSRSKRVNISSKFYTNGKRHHPSFSIPNVPNIPTGSSNTGGVGKNRDS